MSDKKTIMELMTIGISDSGINITKEMVENSIDTFIDKPVVLNYNQEVSDYRGLDIDKWNKERTVGIITSIEIKENKVLGDVIWYDEKYIKNKYDNWQISFEEKHREDNDNFNFRCVEVW